MSSPGHRKNILDPLLADVGIAVIRSGDGKIAFVVEDFATLVHPMPDGLASDVVQALLGMLAPTARQDQRLCDEAARLAVLMATADSERFPVAVAVEYDVSIGYVSGEPSEIPSVVTEKIADAGSFGVAVAFRVTLSHPMGACFVAVLIRRR